MRTSARVSLPIALWLTAALLPGPTAVAAPPPSVPSDFNGDGFADLAVGAPLEDLPGVGGGQITDAGVVHVIYGSANGLVSTGGPALPTVHRLLPQQLDPSPDRGSLRPRARPRKLQRGRVLGPRDRDPGRQGCHREHRERVSTPSGLVPAGGVNVLYGTSTGLSATNNQLWTQESPGIQDVAEEFDFFGCLANCVPWSLLISLANASRRANFGAGSRSS